MCSQLPRPPRSRRFHAALLLLALSGAAVATSADATAARTRLLGPGTATSDVEDDAQFSPNGEWLVARWDVLANEVFRLYAVRRDGSEQHILSTSSPAATVRSFAISLDSRYVVYDLQLASNGVHELWRSPLAGPTVTVRLSPDWTDGNGLLEYGISSDSSRVVIFGDFEVDGIDELWSAPIGGLTGSAVKLNPPPVANAEVFDWQISPDSSRVVFSGDTSQVGRLEYWSVPLAGPSAAAVRLNGTAPVGASTSSSFHISPNSARVIYTGELSTAGTVELWSVPIAGPAASAVKLNPAIVAGGDVRSNHLEITPDSARVVFFGDLLVDERLELWSVPIAGPSASAVRLNPTPVSGGQLNNADPFLISPDSSWLVMHGDLDTVGSSELFRVAINGPAISAVKVHPDAVAGGGVGVANYKISSDSDYVVFSGDLVTDGVTELWSSDRDSPPETAVKLSGSTIAAGDVGVFEIAPDSSRVVFRGDLILDAEYWLFSRAIDGSGARLFLSSELLVHADADVSDWELSADSRDVIYEANPDDPTRTELYRRRIADGGGFQHLSGAAPGFTDLEFLALSPEGRGALYLADVSVDNSAELWIADDWILTADFEENDLSEWSSTTP
ncbi:MAG: hypothetical protein ABI639_12095 [Thermoanaerobaculia bacterium]